MTNEAAKKSIESNAIPQRMETRPNLPLRLGRVRMTKGIVEVAFSEVQQAIERHRAGDWGNICQQDRDANDTALRTGDRILSVYETTDGAVLWIVTDCVRAFTTVMLPTEY
jgi:hypothetical protein